MKSFVTTLNPDPSYTEILKLASMMANAAIPHALRRLYDGWQILFPSMEDCESSIVEHNGSYGHSRDMLEMMGLQPHENEDDVEGWLSAEEVFEAIQKHYSERKKE